MLSPVLIVAFLAFGCGKSTIQIDDSALAKDPSVVQSGTADPNAITTQATAGTGNPVGLLEIQNANRGTVSGFSFGTSTAENVYCGGVLLDNGMILTAAECTRGPNGNYLAKDMKFYIKALGAKTTNSFEIESIQVLPEESSKNIARLWVKGHAPLHQLFAKSSFSTATNLDLADSQSAIATGQAFDSISVMSPNKKGICKIIPQKANVGISATYTDAAAIVTEGVGKKIPYHDYSQATVDRAQSFLNDYAVSAPINLLNIPGALPGSPVLYNTQIVALVKNPNKDGNAANGQWLMPSKTAAKLNKPVTGTQPNNPADPNQPKPTDPSTSGLAPNPVVGGGLTTTDATDPTKTDGTQVADANAGPDSQGVADASATAAADGQGGTSIANALSVGADGVPVAPVANTVAAPDIQGADQSNLPVTAQAQPAITASAAQAPLPDAPPVPAPAAPAPIPDSNITASAVQVPSNDPRDPKNALDTRDPRDAIAAGKDPRDPVMSLPQAPQVNIPMGTPAVTAPAPEAVPEAAPSPQSPAPEAAAPAAAAQPSLPAAASPDARN